ncbi:MAG TPA: PAS domain-containing protein, partial [Gemmatimonadales bacterium]|nr:PAS domain-containing protein [Gemmatimonadales bacterium]
MGKVLQDLTLHWSSGTSLVALLAIILGGVSAAVVQERRHASRSAALQAATTHYQQFLRQVIDTNPNVIFVKDWEGRYVLANAAAAQLYGTTVEA